MSSSMYPQPTAAQRIQQQWLQQKSRPTTTEVNIKPQIQTAAPHPSYASIHQQSQPQRLPCSKTALLHWTH
ncbi:hypothetical protein [Xylella fastidiosa]|uniref:hypothetical protein n=1 Tax=Xylella fastidiosa TaxID=2371 RepID=UPI0013763758|nr:hypothetical protein [Xylella fastidiosa]